SRETQMAMVAQNLPKKLTTPPKANTPPVPAPQNAATQQANPTPDEPAAPQTSNDQPKPPEKPEATTLEPPIVNSPIVKSIDMAPIKAQFDEVLRPITESPYIATVQHSGNGGSTVTIDLWNSDTWDKKGTAKFSVAQQMGDRFVLSP